MDPALRYIRNGIDFQSNIFNGYHAVELGAGNPPAVLNVPAEMTVIEVRAKKKKPGTQALLQARACMNRRRVALANESGRRAAGQGMDR
jgi:hypothetical protein